MKKILAVFLTLAMAFSCVMTVCAEEEPVAVYSIGEIEGDLLPGEIITVPVYLSVKGEKVTTVTFRMKFDNERLELEDFKSAEGKGDHTMSFYFVDLKQDDNSVIGVNVADLSMRKPSTLEDTLLINIKFKIKDNITSGDMNFGIVFSAISSIRENLEEYFFEEYEAEEKTVYIEGNSEGSDVTDEGNDEENEDNKPIVDDGDDPVIDEGDDSDADDGETSDGGREETTPPSVKDEDKEDKEPAAPEFSDLAGYEWAKDYIIPLAQKGIIRGTGETTFSPANNITRADFMVLLMRLLEIGGTETDGFADVPADSYFAAAVTSAKELGIAKGGSDGNFNPYNTITREDMCVLVYRALNSMGYLPVVPDNGTFKTGFSDVDLISDYAYDAMHELYLNQIIGGSDGKVNPKGFATRAETAVIMYRISKLIPEF